MKKSVSYLKKGLFLLLVGIVLLVCFTFLVYAADISSEVAADRITSITEEIDGVLVFEEIEKIYEISDASLDRGYVTWLEKKDAFRVRFGGRNHYIVVWDIIGEDVVVVFSGERQLVFGMDEIVLIDVDQDGRLDVQLELESVATENVNLFIKNIVESELIPEGDYFELFDVSVELAERRISTSRELEAFVVFENFGEGPSEIDIVYSIVDGDGEEVYRGVDAKVVQTEDTVVKDFGFLELPFGKYVLKTEIFYGQNQTGGSEKDFEVVERSVMSQLMVALFFVLVIVLLLFVVKYVRKNYERNLSSKVEQGIKEE